MDDAINREMSKTLTKYRTRAFGELLTTHRPVWFGFALFLVNIVVQYCRLRVFETAQSVLLLFICIGIFWMKH